MTWKEKQIQRIVNKMGDNITGLTDLVGDAEPAGMFFFWADWMAYLLSGDPERVLSERTIRIRRKLNKVIKLLGPLFLERKQVLESKNTLLGIDRKDAPINLPKEPVIWCVNHSFKDDVLATVLSCRHAYILFGSLPAYFNTFDGVTAFINGVVMCNRKVAASRHAAMQNAKRVISAGGGSADVSRRGVEQNAGQAASGFLAGCIQNRQGDRLQDRAGDPLSGRPAQEIQGQRYTYCRG